MKAPEQSLMRAVSGNGDLAEKAAPCRVVRHARFMVRALMQCAGFALPTLCARAQEFFLTIGPEWTIVREIREISLEEGRQEFLLADLPAGMENSSLMIRTRRRDLDLQEWGPAGETVVTTLPLTWEDAGRTLVWSVKARPPKDQRAPTTALRCVLVTPIERKTLNVEILYRLRGLQWEARYQAVVRGDRVEEREPLSVDLSGLVIIRNRSGHAFSNAVIRLVSGASPRRDRPVKPPGFLILAEDSSMADLWRHPSLEWEPQYEYSVPGQVHLTADSDLEVRWVDSMRIPAERRYLLRAEDVPPDLAGPDRPLRKMILVNNTVANRLGVPLPSGPIQLFLSSMRTHLLQTGDLPHTPVNGEIRIDLGPSAEVMGRRGSRERSPVVIGYYQEVFALEVANDREGAITVELDEKPPLVLEWALVRSSHPCQEVFRRLRFNLDVPPGGRRTVDYTLRVKQPSL